MKFNLVGGVGIAVQLLMLWLVTTCGVGYLLATALAGLALLRRRRS